MIWEIRARKGHFIRFGIYIGAVLLLAAYACEGGTGPGDGNGNVTGFLYVMADDSGDKCVKKLKTKDGSGSLTIDMPIGWFMYDIAVNINNGDIYVYFGTDVNKYSKDGALLDTFEDVTVNTLGEKLECSLSGNNRYLWLIESVKAGGGDYKRSLCCLDASTGNRVFDGLDLPEDVQMGPGDNVWVTVYYQGQHELRQLTPTGSAAVTIRDQSKDINTFGVNGTDYSVWVWYEGDTFTHYDANGTELTSFGYATGGSLRFILRVNPDTGDLLISNETRSFLLSAAGAEKFSKTYIGLADADFDASYDGWSSLIRTEEGRFIVNYDLETGSLNWEKDRNSNENYLYASPK